MSDPFKTTAKPYNGQMNPCRVCGKTPKEGDEMWMQNLGDDNNKKWIASPHEECFKKLQENPELGKSAKKAFVSQKFPIGEAPKIFILAEELLESFKKKRNLGVTYQTDGFNLNTNTEQPSTTIQFEKFDPLTTEQELQAIESFFKTMSGAFKP